MLNTRHLLERFDPVTGQVSGGNRVERRLSDLRGCFQDEAAYERALAAGNPRLYTVSSVEAGSGPGDLHYGLGVLMPGRVGQEYYLTKGHYHAWREAAEIYIGLSGEGCMLLQDEATGESRMVELRPNHIVYVPGHTAHRTVNTGAMPLAYLGIYPAKAGHDYGAIGSRNFRCIIIDRENRPCLVERNLAL